ncbi:hypothetical protein EV360DRAFT_67242 [Lentinula raphanica]|nr:hypothetical protein EV360DRAFT_67242 [Lentinula raphanica]
MQRRDIPPLAIPSRRHFSPSGGPASWSKEILIVTDDGESTVPSSPTPMNSSIMKFGAQDIDSVLALPTSPLSENSPRPTLNSRTKSSPSYLTLSPTPYSPSFTMPMTPPPSPLKSSSRPPSRESVKSLPVPIHTPTPPNFPRVLHRNSSPTVHTGIWQNTNVNGEAPQFSRHNMGSDVIMPIPARNRQTKPVVSPKPKMMARSPSPVASTSTLNNNFLAPPPFRRHARRRSNSTSAIPEQRPAPKEPVARVLESPSESSSSSSGNTASDTSHISLSSLRARTKSVLDRGRLFVHARAQAISNVDSILGPAAHKS